MNKKKAPNVMKIDNTKNTYVDTLTNSSKAIPKIQMIPLVLLIVIVPLIVRLKIKLLSVDVAKFWDGSVQPDFYSYNKAMAIISISSFIVLLILLTFKKDDFKIFKKMKVATVAIVVFIILTLVSSQMSENKSIALWGAPERYEGMIVHLCYIIIMIYSIIVVRTEKSFRVIIYAFIFLVGIMTLIGLSQVSGRDILDSDFVYNLMVPIEYKDIIGERIKSDLVYLTLMNPNYVGSYASLIIPFFTAIAISDFENYKLRITSSIIVALTLIILVKSNSQAGIVGVGVGIFMLIIMYFRNIFKSKNLLIATVVFAVALAGVTNIFSKGLLLDNTLDIFRDAKRMIENDSDYIYDPTYGLPIYGVKAEGNMVRVETVDGQLNLNYTSGLKIEFKDTSGNIIPATYNNELMRYSFLEPYNNLIFAVSNDSTSEFSRISIYYKDSIYYILEYSVGKGAYLINSQGYRYELGIAPHIGFEGKEKVGSMRGYIWSRTFPMILEKPFFGYGPDNFLMAFPHYDVVAKTYAYDTPFMIVDKPHNIYLLYAVNSGIIALGAMLVLWGMYIVKSFRTYAFKKEYTKSYYYGTACTVAVTGYLASGFFNDSVVSLAPLFWILLGAGYAMNALNNRN